MRRMPWATNVWPGLPQLWSCGEWSGLLYALGFAALVNVALLGTLVWSELFASGVRNLLWLAVGAFWVISAVFSYRWHRQPPAERHTGRVEDEFGEALDHYLKGNWYEAEHVLLAVLRRNPRDLDAGLMLATLLRHTRRPEEATAWLDRLERFDGSEKWALEICRERELLAAAAKTESQEAEELSGASEPAGRPAEMLDAA